MGAARARGAALRVLLVEPDLRDNGAIRSNVRMAQRWSRAGAVTHLLAVQRVDPAAQECVEVPPPVRVGFVTDGRRRLRRTLPGRLVPLLRLARSADVVVAGREIGPGLLAAWALARLTGRPLVVMLRSAPHRSIGSYGRPWHRRPTLRALRGAEAVICISDGLVPSARSVGVAEGAVRVVLNGVDVEGIRAAAARPGAPVVEAGGAGPLVVGVGRLSTQKGFDVLVRAHARALADGAPPHRVLVLGEGELRPELEDLVRQLGVQGSVSLPGFADPLPTLSRADLFCLPSRWEGFGQSLAEALLLGVPVIAADCVSGPREQLQGGAHGELVPVDDEVALAAALRRHLDDPGPLRAAAGRGRLWAAEHLDVDRSAAQMLDVVAGVAGARARRRGRPAPGRPRA